jgi:predicted MFS family arabinose efflux permease
MPVHELTGRRSRTPFVALLALTMAIAAIVIPTFGVLAPFLRDDLGITRAQLGWLVTVVALVSAVGSPPLGRLTDLLGGRRLVLGVFAGGVVAGVWMAMSPSYLWLFGAALVGGLVNAAGNPATNKLISTYLKPGERGTVTGIKQSGVQAGIFLAGLSLPPAAFAFGWRTAAALVAVVAVVGLVTTLRVIPADQEEPDPGETARPEVPEPPTSYTKVPLVRAMTAYAFLMGGGTAAMTAFLPLYVAEGVALGATAGGLAAAVMGVVGIGARIVLARATEHIASFLVPLAWLAAVAAAATITLMSAIQLPVLVWIGSLLAGIGVMGWNAVAMLAVVVRVPRGQAGRSTGIIFLGFMGGYTLSPVSFGAVVDATGQWSLAWAGALGLFALAGLLAVATRRTDRIPEPAGPEGEAPSGED